MISLLLLYMCRQIHTQLYILNASCLFGSNNSPTRTNRQRHKMLMYWSKMSSVSGALALGFNFSSIRNASSYSRCASAPPRGSCSKASESLNKHLACSATSTLFLVSVFSIASRRCRLFVFDQNLENWRDFITHMAIPTFP